MDWKTIFTVVGIAVTLLSFVLYYKDIISGHTKPHAFSWLVWGVLETTGFALQFTQGGGVGSWILGISMCITMSVAVVGFIKRSLDYTITDWLALSGALLGIVLWWFTKQPMVAAILITLSDCCGFIPTFRKGWLRPHEESISMYALSSFKQGLSAAAVQPSFVTVLYPLFLVFANAAFVVLLLVRRRAIPKPKV